MVKVVKVYEGVLEVLEIQGDDIDIIKSEVEKIKSYVITQTVWTKDIDEELSHIPVIREQVAGFHSLFMANFSSPYDDAKKVEEMRQEKKPISQPALHAPIVSERYTVPAGQAALVPGSQKNIFTNFGILEDIESRSKGRKDPNYSNNKIMEQIAKERVS